MSFEILGMLSQTFHIPDTFYTNIPNPTPDSWDSRTVSMPMMLRAFKENIESTLPGRPRNDAVVAKLNHHLDEIIKHLDDNDGSGANNRKTLYRFRALHDAIATADEILTGNKKPSSASTSTTATTATETVSQPNGGAPQPSANTETPTRPPLRNPGTNGRIPGLDDEADHQRNRRIMVQDVLRAHIQEVLRILNDRDGRPSDQRFLTVEYGGGRPQSRGRNRSPSQSSHQDISTNLEDMDEASPDERQHRLIELYFQRVRRIAVPRAAKESAHRRQSVIARPAAASRRGSVGSQMSTVTEAAPLSPVHPLREVANAGDDDEAGNTDRERAQLRAAAAGLSTADTENAIDSAAASPRDGQGPVVTFALFEHSVAQQLVTHDDIWCTLVFRMICWLMLHDFSKSDQQISRSELLGSRMPVYIE